MPGPKILDRMIVFLVAASMMVSGIYPMTVHGSGAHINVNQAKEELLKKYPGAKIIHIEQAEYTNLSKKLQRLGYEERESVQLYVAQNTYDHDRDVRVQYEDETNTNDCIERQNESASEDSFRVIVDLTEDMLDTRGGGSSDEAAVVFIIVGAVVLIVWTLYIFKYFYDVSIGAAPCESFSEFTYITSSADTTDEQHIRFNGLKYATGVRDIYADVGISIEFGEIDILLRELSALELKGNYWLLGPVLRWRLSQGINPNYLQMEFTAGSTEHDEVGLIAKAMIGAAVGIGNNMQLGFGWGAMNIDLNGDQGIITERNQYHYLYSLNFGYTF